MNCKYQFNGDKNYNNESNMPKLEVRLEMKYQWTK